MTCDLWSRTFDIPAGDDEVKIAIDESWDEDYGDGGVQNGPNIPFTVEDGDVIFFSYYDVTHVLLKEMGESLVRADQRSWGA